MRRWAEVIIVIKINVLSNKNGYMKETQRICPEKNMNEDFLKISIEL